MAITRFPSGDIVPPLRRVIRLATEADHRVLANNQVKEKRAFDICQQKIQEHKLDMKLVAAEYAFDGSKILFFFTADGSGGLPGAGEGSGWGFPHPD